jgi:hypothetical protein
MPADVQVSVASERPISEALPEVLTASVSPAVQTEGVRLVKRIGKLVNVAELESGVRE